MPSLNLLDLPVELILEIMECLSINDLTALMQSDDFASRIGSSALRKFLDEEVKDAFLWACHNNHVPGVHLLLPRVQRIDSRIPYEGLISVCNVSNDAETVRILVNAGIPFHPPRDLRPLGLEREQTPLHRAMQ
ncbi:hypothetical protein BDW59DRAFT_167437 [Aspergillus cavernicola]|uniref:F-box domain-containing protein n=1 Tax=Aspergillus cavernicola TaxID=176166 RepID=A0ABR4HF32_9EURO